MESDLVGVECDLTLLSTLYTHCYTVPGYAFAYSTDSCRVFFFISYFIF